MADLIQQNYVLSFFCCLEVIVCSFLAYCLSRASNDAAQWKSQYFHAVGLVRIYSNKAEKLSEENYKLRERMKYLGVEPDEDNLFTGH